MKPEGITTIMTDKQLRSLSKRQMLNILHQQEKEIERLNAKTPLPPNGKPSEFATPAGQQSAFITADSQPSAFPTPAGQQSAFPIPVGPPPAFPIITDMDSAFPMLPDPESEFPKPIDLQPAIRAPVDLVPVEPRGSESAGASALLEEIVRSAQETADLYVKKIKEEEDEKIIAATNLENQARRRCEEADIRWAEASAAAKQVLADVCNVFEWQIGRLTSMYSEFRKVLGAPDFRELLPPEHPQDPEL